MAISPPPPPDAFDVPPQRALEMFRAKGLKPTFAWQDMAAGEHAHAFTIAKMMDVDLLADVRASLDAAMATGIPFAEWQKTITPMLQAKGWWGRQLVTDPATGKQVMAQLGSASRLETIFRTNMQSAYMAAQWEQIQSQAAEAPYLMYDAIDDYRTRGTHRAWDGTVLPIDSEWWSLHYPPCGWNCRCSVIQMSDDELEALGLKPTDPEPSTATKPWQNPRTGQIERIPVGVDPGFGRTPMKKLEGVATTLGEKVGTLPADMQAAAEAGLVANDAAIAAQIESRIVKSAQKAAAAKVRAGIAAAEADAAATDAAIAGQVEGRVQKTAKQAARGAAQDALAADAFQMAAQEAAALEAAQEAAAAAAAEQNAAAAKLSEAAKLAPTTPQGKALAALKKLGAIDDADPVGTLAKLEAKVVEQKAAVTKGTQLGHYKSKLIAGKIPTEAQQAAFASLSAADQEALLVQVQQAKDKLAAIAAAEAQTAADALAAEQAALAAAAEAESAAAALAAEQAAAAAKKAAELAAAAEAADAAALEQASAAAALADAKAAKKAAAAAKKAAKKAAAVADAATPAAKAAVASTAPLDGAAFTQIGPQAGSNPGGLFQNVETGEKWYVKFPANPAIARNEALTAQLYELAGVQAPEYRFVDMPDGRRGIASKFVDGLERDPTALKLGTVEGVGEGFGADAWLANWDVVGLSHDNMLVKAGRAYRVDTGGGLIYRAQGSTKGVAWGDVVTEIDSLRDARINPQAAQVFGPLTPAQIQEGVRRVLRVSDADIERVVDAWGPVDALERQALKARLIARKQDLWDRFPDARPDAVAAARAPVADATARITAIEQDVIEAARLNGYTVRTDKDLIEDQDVLVAVVEKEGLGAVTRGNLKLLAKGDALLQTQITEGLAGVKTIATVSDLDQSFVEILKGINSRAAKGGTLDAVTITRWNALKPRIDAAAAKLLQVMQDSGDYMTPAQTHEVAKTFAHLKQWQTKLAAVLDGRVATDLATPIEGIFETGKLLDIQAGVQEGVAWRKQSFWQTDIARTQGGRAFMTGQKQTVIGVDTSYHAEVDGVRVTYIPFNGNPRARAFQGTLQIEVTGAGADASARVFAAMERLGLNAERAQILDRQELYLNRLARLHTLRNDTHAAEYKALDTIEDQSLRVKEKIARINRLTGTDVTKNEEWGTWEGQYQAFGHGHAHQFRSDIDPAEFNKFTKQHVIYHNPTGLSLDADEDMRERMERVVNNGGQLASLTDRVRRGIPLGDATSAPRDIADGGGTGVFTRVRKVVDNKRYPSAGVYWNPRQSKRLDMIAYPRDKYGDSTDITQREYRKVKLDEWQKMATDPSNEMVFKHELSLFDDVEAIVMPTKDDAVGFIAWMREQGYKTWPDGRPLETVVLPPQR